MAEYRSPLESDQDYVLLLGTVSARWSLIEELIAHLLGRVLGSFDTGYDIYFSVSSFRQKIELVKAAINTEMHEQDSIEMCEALDNVYRAFSARNKMIHQPYHAAIIEDGILSHTHIIRGNDPVQWVGKGRYNAPVRINKGEFQGHLERLDRLISMLVEEIDRI
tara:strand:+ start:4327 stop:4818 length:492 start_codon:yes stop_codon:yes gene_type:complete